MWLNRKGVAVLKPSKNIPVSFFVILVAIVLVQLVFLAVAFPLSKAGSGAYLWHIDNPYHLYQIELGRALMKQGLLVGFDPFFAGGYLGGITYNASAKLPVLIGALLPGSVSTGVLYSLYVLTCALIAPLSIALMAKALRWPFAHTAVASLVGLAFWWIGAMRWYHTAGLVSYVCACYLGLAYCAWTWAVCTRKDHGGSRHILLAGLAGGLGVWVHPLFPVTVGALFLAILVVNWTLVNFRSLFVRALAIAAITVFVNLPWLISMTGSPNLMTQQPYQQNIGFGVFAKPMLGLWSGESMGSLLNPLFSVALLAGIVLLPRGPRRQAIPFMLGGALLLIFAAFGAFFPVLGGLQPNRFVAPAFLIIGLGAAFCLSEFMVRLHTSGGLRIKLIGNSVAVLVVLLIGREMYREATPGPHGHYGKSTAEIADPPIIVAQLESWIRENTTPGGRILFETSLGRIHGGGHIAGILAWNTRREFIGGPYPFSNPEVSFWDGVGFGRPIQGMSKQHLSDGLDLYNIGWVFAHSSNLIKLLNRLENIQLAAEFGPVRVFKVNRTLSYLQLGQGRVQARDFNRVEVVDAAGAELILRYQWVPGLATVPPAIIEPVRVHPAFPPVIRVISPPRQFVLTVCSPCDASVVLRYSLNQGGGWRE